MSGRGIYILFVFIIFTGVAKYVETDDSNHGNVTYWAEPLTRMWEAQSTGDGALFVCPEMCACNKSNSQTTTNCEGGELTEVPGNISHTATSLYLSFNNIAELGNLSFVGLKRLTILNLSNIRVERIQIAAFSDLRNLKILDLSHNLLQEIGGTYFKGLHQLFSLHLSNNKLEFIHRDAFDDLDYLTNLFIHKNPVFVYSPSMFQNASNLTNIWTDDHMICCSAPGVGTCSARSHVMSVSTCADLVRSGAARAFLWILALIIGTGNVAVILIRVVRKELRKMPAILTLNLATADLLMSVYLVIIASADVNFRDAFFQGHLGWRGGAACRVAGTLFTLSAEVSVMTLALITMERFLVITRPEVGIRLSNAPGRTYVTCLVTWGVGILLATIPLVPSAYFRGEYYSRSTACLPLPLTSGHHPGWEYVIAVFLGLNSASLATVVMGYSFIFVTVRRNARRDLVNAFVARKMTLLVIADLCCWLPVLVLLIIALISDIPEVGPLLSWVALYMVPLNPAMSPVVYTLAGCTSPGGKAPHAPGSPGNTPGETPKDRTGTPQTVSSNSPGKEQCIDKREEDLIYVERRGQLDWALDDGLRLGVADIHTLMQELNVYMKDMREAGVQSFTVNESTVVLEQTKDSRGKTELHFWLESEHVDLEVKPRDYPLQAYLGAINPAAEEDCCYDDSEVQLSDLVSRLMRRMNYN